MDKIATIKDIIKDDNYNYDEKMQIIESNLNQCNHEIMTYRAIESAMDLRIITKQWLNVHNMINEYRARFNDLKKIQRELYKKGE